MDSKQNVFKVWRYYLPLPIILGLLFLFKNKGVVDVLWNFSVLSFSYFAAMSDLKTRKIPNKMVLGMILTWFVLLFLFLMQSMELLIAQLIISLVGFGVAAALFLIVYGISRGGLGGGDVKFMSVMGLYLGYDGILYATLIGSVLLSIIGITLILLKKIGKKDALPFAPFLLVGIVFAVLAL